MRFGNVVYANREGIQSAYSLFFDIAGPTGDTIHWLDFKIQLKLLLWSSRYEEFIALPPWAAPSKYAFNILAGRVARWREMQLELKPTEFAEALVCLLADFHKHGWSKSKKTLRKAVHKLAVRCRAAERSLILRMFQSFCRAFSGC